MTLSEFFAALDRVEGPLPLGDLVRGMEALEVDVASLGDVVQFSPHHYKRNLVRLGRDYAALVLCWAPGQKSPIHDHVGSACGVRVLQGTATERVFTLTPEGALREGATARLPSGGVCGSYHGDMHEVRNDSPDENLITLHVYTPPLSVYHVFDEATGKRSDKEDAETRAARAARGGKAEPVAGP